MSLPRHSWKCHDPPPGPLTKCSTTNDGEDAHIPENAAASLHVSREMRSTFISCIFNIRLYKRCRTEPGVYESIEQRVMAAEGRLRARLNFLLLNVNEVRRKERSFSRALDPIVPWINHETSLTVAWLSYAGVWSAISRGGFLLRQWLC